MEAEGNQAIKEKDMADTFAVQVMKKLRGVRGTAGLTQEDQRFIDHLDLNARRAGGPFTKASEIALSVTLFDEIQIVKEELLSVEYEAVAEDPEKAAPE